MKNIESTLVDLLIKEKMKLATAESCTGGLIAQKITSVSGASECFDCGVVTYSNEQKINLIGDSAETLEKYGAVSMQTSLEMCKGVKELAKADFGISVTGIAGPTGGTAEKPVGTVWIGICGKKVHKAEKFLFDGDRNQVREATANTALKMVMEIVNGIS